MSLPLGPRFVVVYLLACTITVKLLTDDEGTFLTLHAIVPWMQPEGEEADHAMGRCCRNKSETLQPSQSRLVNGISRSSARGFDLKCFEFVNVSKLKPCGLWNNTKYSTVSYHWVECYVCVSIAVMKYSYLMTKCNLSLFTLWHYSTSSYTMFQ